MGNMNHHPRIHPFGSNRGKGRVGNKAGTSRWGILGQINRSRRRPDPFLVLASVPPPHRPGELGRPPTAAPADPRQEQDWPAASSRLARALQGAAGTQEMPPPPISSSSPPARSASIHLGIVEIFFCQRKKRDRLRAPSATPH